MNDKLKKIINKIFWNSYAYVYDDIVKYYNPYKHLNNFIYNFISKKIKKGIVFDAGCGTGEIATYLANKYKVIAGDFSEEMIKKLNNKIRKNNIKNISAQIIDLNKKLYLKNKQFDIVVNIHSLFMLDDIFFTLSEFCRIIKKKGYLIIAHHKPIKLGVVVKKIIDENGLLKGILNILHLFFVGLFNIILGFLHRKIYGDMKTDEIIRFVKSKKFNIILKKNLYNNFDEVLIFKKR